MKGNRKWQITLFACAGIGLSLAGFLRPASGEKKGAVLEFFLQVNRKVYMKSDYGEPPQMAIWLEQPETGIIRTIWVSRRSGLGIWKGKAECLTCLPYWQSRYHLEKKRRSYKKFRNELFDGISGATPKGGGFRINAVVPPGSRWHYFIEMNISGDYNVSFPARLENGAPDPEGNGQPSLIYGGRISTDSDSTNSPELIGRSGQWQAVDYIIKDLKGITSAKEIISHIRVSAISGGLKTRTQD